MESLPTLSESLIKSNVTRGLVQIWENLLRRQKNLGKDSSKEAPNPRIVIAVDVVKMTNLVPQGAPHPLYHPDFSDLTVEFILDHLSTQSLEPLDPLLNSDGGVLVKTMSDKTVTFKKRAEKFYVNDIEVICMETLPDQTVVVCISSYLFDHHEKVQEAFKALQTQNKDQCHRC